MSAQLTQSHQLITFPTPSVDTQLEAKLDRYMELKALNTEFNRLAKELKSLFEGTADTQVGCYQITGHLEHRDGYQVKAYSFWNWKVSK